MNEHRKRRRMRELADALPPMRRRAARLMKSGGPDSQLGATFGVVNECYFRPGSSRAVNRSGTFGATTLRPEHIRRRGGATEISFLGKAGVQNHCSLPAGPVSRALAMSGGGRPTAPVSRLNEFMHPFTAKDLRTWGANVLYLRGRRMGLTPRDAIHATARRLSHKPSVCKKYYVLPCIREADDRAVATRVRRTKGLSGTESLLRHLLSGKQ